VRLAKNRFSSRNKPGNKTFVRVKEALDAMCSGARRCVYCEDNYADEVEHMRPKDVYPAQAFCWENYVYACGPCNGPKNNHFAVLDAAGVKHDVTPSRGDPDAPRVPPVPGDPMLLDPRVEDPMQYLVVDIVTGAVVPMPGLDDRDRRRAEYTRDVLGMNDRRLPKARRDAFGSYRARLAEYVAKKEAGAAQEVLDALCTDLCGLAHPTVWAEVKRQHQAVPELADLFARAPEAVDW
jgi:uncharacterized protein (TIGR02646 family)